MMTKEFNGCLKMIATDGSRTSKAVPDQGSFTMARIVHNPYGRTLIEFHTPFALTGIGTGWLIEFDSSETQTARILHDTSPPTHRLPHWTSNC